MARPKKVNQIMTVATNATQTIQAPTNERASGIVVNDPISIRPGDLPLVVILPPGASKAQIERAKVLNGYAYSHPEKWKTRKDELLRELEALKDSPDPREPEVKLTVGRTLSVN